MKKVMSVGQCNPDHYALSGFLTKNFSCSVVRIDSTEEAIENLQKDSYDLVLVNRKLDIDYTDGTILIEKMKSHPSLKNIPIMLISNYPEYQDEAIKLGAVKGIGKLEYGSSESVEKFKNILETIPSV
jgi:two-component SAPR family response regulator